MNAPPCGQFYRRMVSCYSDTKKCTKAMKMKNSRAKVKELKVLADSGNVDACVEYGMMLMKGIWDEYQMGIDLVRGKLSPPEEAIATEETKEVEYLIHPRDPIKAVEYFQLAASYRLETCEAKKTAEFILEHCKKFGLAGFKASHVQPVIDKDKDEDETGLSKYYVKTLDSCGISAVSSDGGDVESNQSELFVPLPDVRPKARNPLTAVFQDSGNLNSEIGLDMIFITVAGGFCIDLFFSLVFFALTWSFNYKQIFHLIIFLSAFVVVPQLMFSFLFMTFGEEGNLPICDCKEIREAYKESIKGLPEDIVPKKDPFKTTNVIIRKLKYLRQWLIWSYILAFFLQIVTIAIYSPFRQWMMARIDGSYFVLTWIFPGCLALISGFMLVFEKDFDDHDCYDYDYDCDDDDDDNDNDNDGLFDLFLTTICFWDYRDTSCLRILEQLKDNESK